MLKHLHIRNLALIQNADLDLHEGFCAVTGESGAGKSVLLSALRLCAGDKASAHMVRAGEEKALVEAHFETRDPAIESWFSELGIESADGEISIQREILASGKSRARVNGSMVSQNDLARLGDLLIQFHGQSEQVLLRDVRTHLDLLDEFGDLGERRYQYHEAWKTWRQAVESLETLERKASELATQKEFLQFQYQELEKARLNAGEEEELEKALKDAEEQSQRQESLNAALDLIENDGGLLEKHGELERYLDRLQRFVPQIESLSHQIAEAHIALRELARELRGSAKHHALSPQELERINARLAQLQKLRRKYRLDITGLIQLRDQRKAELDTLENLDGELEIQKKKIAESLHTVKTLGKALSAARREAAGRLEQNVEAILRRLGMPKAVFRVSCSEQNPQPSGMDQVEFMIAPNPGEGVKSLKQAVSGGELSRVLLAFKSALAHRDRIPVLVFDEVDSGISGETAHFIGECLRELGRYHQVLTITHLHQVASKASWQILVRKEESAGRTFTSARILSPEERIRELARMLGDPDSPTVLQHARQLYEANHAKNS